MPAASAGLPTDGPGRGNTALPGALRFKGNALVGKAKN